MNKIEDDNHTSIDCFKLSLNFLEHKSLSNFVLCIWSYWGHILYVLYVVCAMSLITEYCCQCKSIYWKQLVGLKVNSPFHCHNDNNYIGWQQFWKHTISAKKKSESGGLRIVRHGILHTEDFNKVMQRSTMEG